MDEIFPIPFFFFHSKSWESGVYFIPTKYSMLDGVSAKQNKRSMCRVVGGRPPERGTEARGRRSGGGAGGGAGKGRCYLPAQR